VSHSRAPALNAASNPQARKQVKQMSRIKAMHVSPQRRMVHPIRRYDLIVTAGFDRDGAPLCALRCRSLCAFCWTSVCVACHWRKKLRHDYVTPRKLKGPASLQALDLLVAGVRNSSYQQ